MSTGIETGTATGAPTGTPEVLATASSPTPARAASSSSSGPTPSGASPSSPGPTPARAASSSSSGATPAYPVDSRESAADRFMRRLLRVRRTNRNLDAAAHRRLRLSLFVSAIRCVVTYVLIPVLVPLLSIAGVLAAPVGIALCAVAVVSGIAALRRFWATDHKGRWMYTWFIAVVFLVLAVGLVADVSHLVSA